MDPLHNKRIDILLEEYRSLKGEQQARIGFRDNLLYVMLGAAGGIVAFSLSRDGPNAALLAIPWAAFIVGWTYLVNDEKISAIGRYIRAKLEPDLRALIEAPEGILGWESAHRGDHRRRGRKLIQLLVDLLTFVGSGLAAIALYLARETAPGPAAYWLCAGEAGLLALLTFQILSYFDWSYDSVH